MSNIYKDKENLLRLMWINILDGKTYLQHASVLKSNRDGVVEKSLQEKKKS